MYSVTVNLYSIYNHHSLKCLQNSIQLHLYNLFTLLHKAMKETTFPSLSHLIREVPIVHVVHVVPIVHI